MKKSFLFLLAANCSILFGQHFCGTDEYIQKKIAENPELSVKLDEMYRTMEEFRTSPKPAARSTKTVYYIPVVFHVIHDGKAYGVGENISDEQIYSQIDALNRDFALMAGDTVTIPAEFKPLAANTYIQFCLAKFDPQGNPTNGINRVVINKSSWNSENEIETQVKPATIWNRRRYLNIWSLRFGGSLLSGGTLAYATLPYFTDDQTDGIAARFNTIGTIGTLLTNQRGGRTIVHEVGHWLGLLHIWGNRAGCYDGTFNTTDFIDDTPDQYDKYFGCPTYPQ
ncbi:MAG: M43 family zinc metalloprotease, partial [Chitinophagales bacterium]|nr:M43 family zinc metalloprotease [Chitinophagales bacterium]